MKDSLLIYSGGHDSTVLLYDQKENIALACSFDYGSKHNKREIEQAAYNCAELNIKHIIINIQEIGKHLKSSLLDRSENVPHGHYEDETMKSTVVPFRNGIMLSVAAGIAESNNLSKVLIASHAGDHAIYPDCRVNFTEAFKVAVKLGTYNNVEILAPYGNFTKRLIAIIGEKIGVDSSHTYSCYEGEELHCGKCGTCVERKEALEGFDQTRYEDA